MKRTEYNALWDNPNYVILVNMLAAQLKRAILGLNIVARMLQS